MQPLTLLQVTPYYEAAWGYGGIPRAVAPLCHGLAARGHRVLVCTTDARDAEGRLTAREPDPQSRVPPPEGIDIRVFPNLSNRLAYQSQLFLPVGMRAQIDELVRASSVVHIHGCRHVPGTLAAASCRRQGVPYVVSTHGTAPLIERRRIRKWLFDQTFGHGFLSNATRVLAVSRAEQRQLSRLGVPSDKQSLIPNPVELEQIPSAPDTRVSLRQCAAELRHVVLYLGRLSPRKDVDVLMRAFARLDRVDSALVIAGPDAGSYRSLRRLAQRLGIAPRVRFLGLLRGSERIDALRGADIVAYPGRLEVFGLVAFEALLCGTPVVLADDCGCGEIATATGGGLTFRAGDPSALATTLSVLLDDLGRWRTAASSARAHILERYSRAVVAAQVERLYGEIVASGKGIGADV